QADLPGVQREGVELPGTLCLEAVSKPRAAGFIGGRHSISTAHVAQFVEPVEEIVIGHAHTSRQRDLRELTGAKRFSSSLQLRTTIICEAGGAVASALSRTVRKRRPSALTSYPLNGTVRRTVAPSGRGIPALNIGVVTTSTAMTLSNPVAAFGSATVKNNSRPFLDQTGCVPPLTDIWRRSPGPGYRST